MSALIHATTAKDSTAANFNVANIMPLKSGWPSNVSSNSFSNVALPFNSAGRHSDKTTTLGFGVSFSHDAKAALCVAPSVSRQGMVVMSPHLKRSPCFPPLFRGIPAATASPFPPSASLPAALWASRTLSDAAAAANAFCVTLSSSASNICTLSVRAAVFATSPPPPLENVLSLS